MKREIPLTPHENGLAAEIMPAAYSFMGNMNVATMHTDDIRLYFRQI